MIEEDFPSGTTQECHLVREALAGNSPAFNELIRRYRVEVISLISRQVDHRNEVEELFQDVIIRAYFSLQNLRDRGRFKSWLMRIAYHTAVDRVRRRMMVEEPHFLEEDPPDLNLPQPGEPEDGTTERCLPHIVKEITKLRPLYAMAIMLRSLEGMGYKDISRHLKISVPCVKMYLHRARHCLRDQMAVAFVEDVNQWNPWFRNLLRERMRCDELQIIDRRAGRRSGSGLPGESRGSPEKWWGGSKGSRRQDAVCRRIPASETDPREEGDGAPAGPDESGGRL